MIVAVVVPSLIFQLCKLKELSETFFNSINDDDSSKMNNILSYGQQQMLNIQETFFKSKINFHFGN